jgi:NAD-dependent DNA ligase
VKPTVEPRKKSDSAIAGTTWVITGTLSQPRDQIAEMIRERGGKVSGSVSKKTNYLLAGEEAGSKLDKAKKLGVKIIGETDFRRLISSSRPYWRDPAALPSAGATGSVDFARDERL